MAELGGNLMYVKISPTAFATSADGTRIVGVNKTTLKQLAEILETTSFGDTYKKRVSGIKDSSLDLSGSYDPADAGQIQLVAGDTVYVALFPQGLGKAGKAIQMIVESFEQDAEVSGLQTFSASLQGTDAPVDIAS